MIYYTAEFYGRLSITRLFIRPYRDLSQYDILATFWLFLVSNTAPEPNTDGNGTQSVRVIGN